MSASGLDIRLGVLVWINETVLVFLFFSFCRVWVSGKLRIGICSGLADALFLFCVGYIVRLDSIARRFGSRPETWLRMYVFVTFSIGWLEWEGLENGWSSLACRGRMEATVLPC